MINFELSNILENTRLSTSLDSIIELANKLSLQTSEYISNTKNQTTGVTPESGSSIASLPEMNKTSFFVNKAQEKAQNLTDEFIPLIYMNTVWQFLIATQTIPLGWLYNVEKYSSYKYDRLCQSWNMLVLGNETYDPLCLHTSSFGIVARFIGGRKNSDLVFFAIYNNQIDYNYLQNCITNLGIDNIVLMTEAEYASKLTNGMYYNFLVKFDKSSNPYSGVVFKAITNLIEAVPTHILEVGCSNSCVLYKDKDNKINNPHLNFVEFKKGAEIATTVHVPANYSLYMVALNGTSYFRNTPEMDAAGITIVETDAVTLTGYKTYSVIVSGLTGDSKLYIAACDNLSKTQTTKSMISKESTISVTQSEVTLSLIFNRPFIFLDKSKIKVWAKKDENSEEELVTNITYIMNEMNYVERKALFVDHKHIGPRPNKPPFNPHNHDVIGWDIEPNVHYSRPITKPPIQNEPSLVSHAILYGVSEVGSLIMTFDSYATYKYFRVEFMEDAMVSVFKVQGTPDFDVIPYVEDATFTNDFSDTIIDDDADDGVNNDGISDNNTNPDVIIGSELGISYDA